MGIMWQRVLRRHILSFFDIVGIFHLASLEDDLTLYKCDSTSFSMTAVMQPRNLFAIKASGALGDHQLYCFLPHICNTSRAD